MTTPTPTDIKLHQKSRILEVLFDEGSHFELPCEYLRVYSPSAEVRGHSPGQETLQTGKQDVTIIDIQPVGHYGIKPTFSDGHDSGIFTWETLFNLGANHEKLWQAYLDKLKQAGHSRIK